MKVLLFGATGMIGQAVLREALLADDVSTVVAVGRTSTGRHDPKLREHVLPDVSDLLPLRDELAGCDACLFCLGVTSFGLSEQAYRALTYDLTLRVARTLVDINRAMTFVYVSGAGTDSTEGGRTMWARVKGRTENALLRLPFAAAYMMRPGAIVPMHGIRSRTRWYNALYAVLRPLSPALRALLPGAVTTTDQMARAMLAVARNGYATPVLETKDINRVADGR